MQQFRDLRESEAPGRGQGRERVGAGDSLLQHRLPLAKPGTDGEAVDSALDLGTPLPHVVLNVKQEGLLPKVGVHNLPGCLQAYGGVEVGLRRRMKCQLGPEGKGGQQGLTSSHPAQSREALAPAGRCFGSERTATWLGGWRGGKAKPSAAHLQSRETTPQS